MNVTHYSIHQGFGDAFARASEAGDACALRALVGTARYRMADAERIPWPALASSWRADMERAQGALDELECVAS